MLLANQVLPRGASYLGQEGYQVGAPGPLGLFSLGCRSEHVFDRDGKMTRPEGFQRLHTTVIALHEDRLAVPAVANIVEQGQAALQHLDERPVWRRHVAAHFQKKPSTLRIGMFDA